MFFSLFTILFCNFFLFSYYSQEKFRKLLLGPLDLNDEMILTLAAIKLLDDNHGVGSNDKIHTYIFTMIADYLMK